MNVEIGTEAPIFLFWEDLFQIFGILSVQCTYFVWMFQFPPDNSLIKKVDITRMIKRSRNRSSLLNYNVNKHPFGGGGGGI